MRAALILLMAGVVLGTAGCERLGLTRKNTVERSLPYRASLKEGKSGTLHVSVKAGVAGLAEVRESARYPVTRHCLLQRGSSDAEWVIDPASGDWAVTSDGQGTLGLQARCSRG